MRCFTEKSRRFCTKSPSKHFNYCDFLGDFSFIEMSPAGERSGYRYHYRHERSGTGIQLPGQSNQTQGDKQLATAAMFWGAV